MNALDMHYKYGGKEFQALCKQPPLFITWTLHRAGRETSYESNHGSPPFNHIRAEEFSTIHTIIRFIFLHGKIYTSNL